MKRIARLCFGLGLMALLLTIFAIKTTPRATAANAVGSVIYADARTDYKSHCATCHGSDGRSRSMHGKHVHARDLTDTQWQDDVTDERLFNSISNGRGKMPAFKQKLSEDRINALVIFVRGLKH